MALTRCPLDAAKLGTSASTLWLSIHQSVVVNAISENCYSHQLKQKYLISIITCGDSGHEVLVMPHGRAVAA